MNVPCFRMGPLHVQCKTHAGCMHLYTGQAARQAYCGLTEAALLPVEYLTHEHIPRLPTTLAAQRSLQDAGLVQQQLQAPVRTEIQQPF